MQQVSSHFLEQTLDKKLMSDLRVRKHSVLELFWLCVEYSNHTTGVEMQSLFA